MVTNQKIPKNLKKYFFMQKIQIFRRKKKFAKKSAIPLVLSIEKISLWPGQVQPVLESMGG